MPCSNGRLMHAARTAAAVALFGVLTPTVQPAYADGVAPIGGAKLRCWFTTRVPAPGQTIDRRFQEVIITGQCNKPVEQIPLIFVDGAPRDVQGAGVTNRFRFAGLSSVFGLSQGTHTLTVIVEPRDPNVLPFTSSWTFNATELG